MAHLQDQIDADKQAIAAHRCPECGIDLKPLAKRAIQSHVDFEFPHGDLSEHQRSDYGRRYRALLDYLGTRFGQER